MWVEYQGQQREVTVAKKAPNVNHLIDAAAVKFGFNTINVTAYFEEQQLDPRTKLNDFINESTYDGSVGGTPPVVLHYLIEPTPQPGKCFTV